MSSIPVPQSTTPTFLRRALLADAAISGATGALMTLAAGPLADLLGLPAPLLRWAGVSLLPFAAWLFYLATRDHMSPPAVWIVVMINVLWVIASIVLLMTRWVSPTLLGYVFTIGQAAAVAVFAEVEIVGLRRSGT